jgi:hypothetical protein
MLCISSLIQIAKQARMIAHQIGFRVDKHKATTKERRSELPDADGANTRVN